jgi:hypothetical protein
MNLRLDRISSPPGGLATAVGQGCVAGSLVTLSIGGAPVGTATANDTGAFTATLQLNVPVGHYVVTAQCGVTLQAAIDVVLSSRSNPPAAAASILLLLLLLILALASTQFVSR